MKHLLLFAALFSINSSLHAQVNLTAHLAGRSYELSRDQLPRRADAHPLASALSWNAVQRGLELTEFTVEAGKLGADVRIIAMRVEPRLFDFSLVHETKANRMTGAWTVDVAPDDAAFAFNAGQFKETGPWGWLVLNGEERRNPGVGPLSVGIAFDSAGAMRWVSFGDLAKARADRAVRFAFQSYPTLLFDDVVPVLPARSELLDRTHRDARLILAQDRAGRMLLVLTRYDGLGAVSGRVPIGLTVPESIVLIAAMGARHAVMLDGGVSAQLLVRDARGSARTWKGLRAVPLALVGRARIDTDKTH
jgi:hypothetical protein